MDIQPIRTEADYEAALRDIETYFDREPEPGSAEADRFDVLATLIEAYERERWPIDPPDRWKPSAIAWNSKAAANRTSPCCSVRDFAHPRSLAAGVL
jgi:hypothetical protein